MVLFRRVRADKVDSMLNRLVTAAGHFIDEDFVEKFTGETRSIITSIDLRIAELKSTRFSNSARRVQIKITNGLNTANGLPDSTLAAFCTVFHVFQE